MHSPLVLLSATRLLPLGLPAATEDEGLGVLLAGCFRGEHFLASIPLLFLSLLMALPLHSLF